MKNTIATIFGAVVVLGIALVAIPTVRDEIHWRWAYHKDDTTSYESYVKSRPQGRHIVEATGQYDEHGWADAQTTKKVSDFSLYVRLHGAGKHVAEAKDKIESMRWQEATSAKTVDGFQRYVQLHGDGKHVAEAKQNIESLQWQKAASANTIKSYMDYVSTYPQGNFLQQAKTRISALCTDETPYDSARRDGNEASLRQFLVDFPGHKKETVARTLYEEYGWTEAEKTNTIQGFERYVQVLADGKHVAEARERIESLHWQETTTTNTIKSYAHYVSLYPRGRFIQQAETKISALRTDAEPYNAARQEGTEASLRKFLGDFPGHDKATQVQQALADWQQASKAAGDDGYKDFLTKHGDFESLAVRNADPIPFSQYCAKHVASITARSTNSYIRGAVVVLVKEHGDSDGGMEHMVKKRREYTMLERTYKWSGLNVVDDGYCMNSIQDKLPGRFRPIKGQPFQTAVCVDYTFQVHARYGGEGFNVAARQQIALITVYDFTTLSISASTTLKAEVPETPKRTRSGSTKYVSDESIIGYLQSLPSPATVQ